MFKKLFTINYNNKEFLILVNEEHRYAFMEIKDNKLVYPDIEDFKKLFYIFNVDNGIETFKLKGERLEEKVDYKSLLLSVLLSSTLVFPVWLDVDYFINKDNSLLIRTRNEQYYKNHICFNSITDLNAYLGYEDISIEDVFEVVDKNENFTERQKEIVKNIITEKVNINPDIDLRLIYENMKDLKIIYVTNEELSEKFNYSNSVIGCYCRVGNEIYLTSDNDELFAHEISHAMHGYYREIDGKYIDYGPGRSVFHENMTNREGSLGVGHDMCGQAQDERVFAFLLNHCDKFNMSIYDEYGIDPLIDELKEKYPEVDIDYIIDFFNAAHNAAVSIDSERISMFDNEYLLDQLYEIAIRSVDENNKFEEINELFIVFNNKEEICNKYRNKYYKGLLDNGFIGTQEYDFITKIDHLVLKDKIFYIGTSENKYFNYDLEQIDETDDCIIVPITEEIKDRIINDYGIGLFVFDNEYTSSLIKDGCLLNNVTANGIRNYNKEDIEYVIDEVFYKMLENCDSLEEIQEQYLLFKDTYETLLITESNYMTVWREAINSNKYFCSYRDFCVEKGLTSERNMSLVEDTEYIVEYQGNYYLAKSISNNVTSYNVFNSYNIGFNRYSAFVNSDIVKVVYIDENFEEKELSISKDAFAYYKIKEKGRLSMQTFFENNDGSIISQELLNRLVEDCNIDIEERYKNAFTLSTGEVIYDGILDDSFYVEFGKNSNNEITYQITQGEKIIYKSCDDFAPLTSKIKYKTFIDTNSYEYNNYMDEIFSTRSLNYGFNSLQPLMRDVKVVLEEYEEVVPINNEDGEIIDYKNIPCINTTIDFINPVVVNIEDQNCYARDIYIYGKTDDNCIYICYPNGSVEQIMQVDDIDNIEDFYSGIFYGNYLEYYLDQNNIIPDEDGIIYISKEQIFEMVKNDITKSDGFGLAR